MPPRRTNATGFTGVRQRGTGAYSAELRAGGERFNLGTFDTADRAARAWDAAAWRVGRPRRTMNFPEVRSAAEAEALAPAPELVTDLLRRRHVQRNRRLDIAASDERAMAEWRRQFPEDVIAEHEFFARRKNERQQAKEARRAARAERRLRKEEAEALWQAGVDIDMDSQLWAEWWDSVTDDTTSLGSDWDDSDE
jgi:hypothetical protein